MAPAARCSRDLRGHVPLNCHPWPPFKSPRTGGALSQVLRRGFGGAVGTRSPIALTCVIVAGTLREDTSPLSEVGREMPRFAVV
jgi:hypothetical protein